MAKIYKSQYSYSIDGRIEQDGKVYDDGYGNNCVGIVDNKGYVYDDEFGFSCVGHVDSNGKVYNYKGDCIGRVEGSPLYKGAAALLLLL